MAKALFKSLPIIHRQNPNVILIPNNTLPNLVVGYIIGKIFRRPLCITVHHIDIPTEKHDLGDVSLYGNYRMIGYSRAVSLIKTATFYASLPLIKKAKAIIAVSKFTAKALKDSGVIENNIHVSGNAIDLNFISNVRPPSDAKIFDGVFVGRIAKEKGIFDLVEIWGNVVRERSGAKLLVIGNGVELASLKESIATANLEENVLIRGQCSDEKLYGFLKSSRVFVFPSRFEGWGIAPAEALACGIPVVAYDIPALREIFGQCTSVFLEPVGNVSKMSQAILKVLNLEDEKLGTGAADYAKNFRWNAIAAIDLKTIKEAAG